jgi:threonine/homoserine/homoserine lactone efflux protein
MSDRKEIQQQFRQQQEKYVYYVLALSVASIAFTIHQTTGLGLHFSQIPAAIAVLSWAGSIYCGLLFMRFVISTLYANDKYLAIIEGDDPETRNNQ